MSKKKIVRSRRSVSSAKARAELLEVYRDRYFNLWMGSWKWEGLNKQQREYLMRRLWWDGKVAAFDILNGTKPFLGGLAPADFGDNAFLGFAPYAPMNWNMYDFPALAQLINNRATPYVPNQVQVVGKKVVLGYVLRSHKPLIEIVDSYLKRIVEVEMTIRTNLFAHKIPFIIPSDQDGSVRGQDLIDRILNDDLAFLVSKGQDLPQPASTGQQYIIDKLYQYKVALENELHTFLGIDNIGAIEKKERLITAETESQDALIDDFSDAIGECLDEFCKEIKEVLGYSISVYPTSSPRISEEYDDKEEEKENDAMQETL